MTARPRRMSSRQSAGGGSRSRIVARLPAMDLMGASELFNSCPSTRTRRCQACSSSSRSGWLRSEITSSSCGRPPSRKELRRIPQRPAPPGNAVLMTRGASPSRQSSRPELLRAPPERALGGLRRAGARRRDSRTGSSRSSSKAKMATSISAMTVRSSVVASSAPSRCSRSVSTSVLTSRHDFAERDRRRGRRAPGWRSRLRAAPRAGWRASAAGGPRARAGRRRSRARRRR